MRFSRIMVGMAAVTALALTSTAANAANVDKAQWDDGEMLVQCTSGVNSRTCSYYFYSAGCDEASTVGVNLAACSFNLDVAVTVVPILNGAGQVVGCTSSALSARGSAEYDSYFSQFDNSSIDDTVIFEVKDTFGDGKPGVAKYTFIDSGGQEGGTKVWTVKGTSVTSCARNVDQWNSGGAGSVTVAV